MRIVVLGDFQGKFSCKLLKKLKKEDFDLVVGVGDYGGIEDWRPWVMQNLRDARAGKEYLAAEEYFGEKKVKQLLKKDELATKDVLSKLNALGKPVIMIFGNGDDGWYGYPFNDKKRKPDKSCTRFFKKLKNIKDVTYSQTAFKNIKFVGFGGYMDIEAYLNKKFFSHPDEKGKHFKRLTRLKRGKRNLFQRLRKTSGERIFVFHYPPMGAFDIIRDKKDNPMNGKSAGVRFYRDAIKKYKPKMVLCGHMHEYQGAKKLCGALVVNPGDAEKGKYAVVDYPSLKVKMVR